MSDVKITIDDVEITVPSHYTVLEAAKLNGIYIPRLCFIKGIHEESSCRVCVVEVEGMGTLKNSCTLKVVDGMKIKTNTPRVKSSMKRNLELISANHTFECWVCPREHNCELLDLLKTNDVRNPMRDHLKFVMKESNIDRRSPAIIIDSAKCLLCGRCVSTCKKETGLEILAFNKRGYKTYIGPSTGHSLEDAGCIYCGKCVQACPVGALREKSKFRDVEAELADKSKYVVVQAAPAVRVALGEEFGYPIGTNVEGKMYAAFKELGFDQIADVNWGADLTIMEEGTEFMQRLVSKGPFPMFTSCSPGWVRWAERYRHDILENLSTAKSPHQMLGSMIKHYWAEKLGVEKENVVVVSIMPCVAKKYEAGREEMEAHGLRDVDYVITTRELARLIKKHKIDFRNLEPYTPQGQLAKYTGAGNIFGATGGVMEAAIRTVVDVLEGKEMPRLNYDEVRGLPGIKEASLTIAGNKVNVAVVHGGAAIKEFFDNYDTNKKKYHFVEIMGCSGGCVNGGGQPIQNAEVLESTDIKTLRAKGLYSMDANMMIRKSHENKAVLDCYAEFLGEPCGKKSHKYLHTHYTAREIYPEHEDK